MPSNEETKSAVEQAGEDLFNYAIERDDVRWLLAQLPKEASVKPVAVEYELQILKIISVGWGLSFFLEGTPKRKATLSKLFWESVNSFSKGLSETTGLMVGKDIDYFEILKSRFDTYLAAMAKSPSGTDPTVVVGPVFAEFCGNKEDIFAAMTGSKMFSGAIQRIRQYLEAVKLR